MQQIQLDAHNLRGIAHPVRLRILSMLRTHGPATASELARSLYLNTGATSYHLRQLAEHGFIVDEDARGPRRERWWRAAHANTAIPDELMRTAEGLGVMFLRTLADVWSDDMIRAINAAPALPVDWRDAQDFSDYGLRLTPAEARELIRQLHAVLKNRRRSSSQLAGAGRYTVQLQMFPALGGDYPEVEEEL